MIQFRRHITCVSVVFLVAGLISSAGCSYEKLRHKNRTLAERNEKLQLEKQQLQGDCDRYVSEIAAKNQLLDQQNKKMSVLQGDKKRMNAALLKLQKEYKDLAGQPRIVIGKALPVGLNKALKKFANEHSDIAVFDEENGMIKLKSDLTFPPGGSTVNEEASATLQKLVEILSVPEAAKFSIYIAGHTDDMPISKETTRRRHPTNWYLAVHRAVGVQKILVKSGFEPSRICVMGFSEYHPVEPNQDGKKGNKANRRVELWVVPSGTMLTKGPVDTTTPAKKEKEPMGS